MLFIAFGHRKNVGKDTAARFLTSYLKVNKRGIKIEVHGFADKLKDVCHQLYSWAGLMPGWYYEKPESRIQRNVVLPKLNKSPRQIWIDFANAIRERTYADTWLDFLLNNSEVKRNDVCIIKDMRFPNEADRIQQSGGLLIKIERPGIVHVRDEADDPLENFSTWDKVFENQEGNLGVLHEQIECLAKEIMPRL